MKKTIDIEGMSCGHCVSAVTDALNKLQGVKSVEVSLENKNAVAEVDDVKDEDLKSAIEDIGFDVVGIK